MSCAVSCTAFEASLLCFGWGQGEVRKVPCCVVGSSVLAGAQYEVSHRNGGLLIHNKK